LSTGLGYLGGVINALGKPGCTVIMATPCVNDWDDAHHPSYRDVWERVMPAARHDPDVAVRDFAAELCARDDYRAAYRDGNGFHAVHPLMGLFPLSRLRHAGRIIAAGADPALARHAKLEPAASIEEGIERALAAHGKDASISLVRYPPALNRSLVA
jgi:hypothetical protein